MFFRRVFSKTPHHQEPTTYYPKEVTFDDTESSELLSPNLPSPPQPVKLQKRRSSIEEKPTRGLSVLQLTPLWEHIIRTNSLPHSLNIPEMFNEFYERLHDPEWQVRQHALRVLVDVLIVMGQQADYHIGNLLHPLVDNLGHIAPAVRKGSLDALRVYVASTAMPETVMLDVMNYGMNRSATDPYSGRMTVAVMLALPALILPVLITPKRGYVVKSVMDALAQKMVQITYQEIALKIFLKIKEMVGNQEFNEYMPQNIQKDFELLCKVYGLPRSPNFPPPQSILNPSKSAPPNVKPCCNSNSNQKVCTNINNQVSVCGKVIMETEIKITPETAVTMRILEQNPSTQTDDSDDESNTRRIITDFSAPYPVTPIRSKSINKLNPIDTELDDIMNNNVKYNSDTDYTRRNTRRVRFGGELVKMRTPDSDTIDQTNVQHSPMRTMKTFERVTSSSSTDYSQELTIGIPDNETVLPSHFTPPNIVIKKTNSLNPNSNYRPATSPMLSPRIVTIPPTSSSNASSKHNSPMKSGSGTPIMQSPSRMKNKTFSPERIRRSASMLSPRMMHREVTMMHNLQRSPMSSPGRSRQPKVVAKAIDRAVEKVIDSDDTSPSSSKDSPIVNHSQHEYKTWEELGIVDYYVLKDLKSGDWHSRSRALCAIEDALKSSDNLAMVQPYLDSLLRSILTAERNTEVIEDQRRLLANLITRLPLENLEDRVTQIVTGMCRQGGAGSNLVAKALMQRLPTASIVLKLLSDDFLQARSSKFRENALQMVIFALMTFPSTYFDIATCVNRTTTAALDRKKRVRQAALDVLAVLGQISSPKNVIEVVTDKVEHRKDGMLLIAAVKARLARKQLPLVGTDGEVQYSLKIPSGNGSTNQGVIMFGSDVEWISSGSGSVSPTSMKNRSFKIQSNGSQQDTGRLFEERRIVEGMNRYSNVGSTNSGTSKFSPWSRIPVKDSSVSSFFYTLSIINNKCRKMANNSTMSRFYGKLQSRSFPELSDATKEKTPIRQLSDSDNQTNSAKWGHNKQPVASTKFPAVENQDRNNSCLPMIKNPYSFAPGFKTKSNMKLPLSSDGFYSDSIGSPLNQSLQLESRPRTHPPTDNIISSANGHRHHKSKRSTDNQQRRNSGKINHNDLMIQPLTSSIALIDDGEEKSHQEEIIKSTTNSARSKKSEAESNKSMVENYVEEQTRRNSVKTNHHILSDTDDNFASNSSTPKHVAVKSADPSLKEMQNVRDEIAQIQTVIENVKKEMVEMQKQQNERSSPSSRPQSENSNKTFVCEDDEVGEVPSRPKTSMSRTRSNEEEIVEVVAEPEVPEVVSTPKTRPSTSKSILKTESPFHRIATPVADEVVGDEQSINSPIDVQLEADYDEEHQQHYEEEQEMEEVDEASQYTTTNNETLMRSDSSMSKDHSAFEDKDHELGEEEEEMLEQEVEFNNSYSPAPAVLKTPSKVKRQPPLKRNHKVTPVKNAMPNLNQQPLKVTSVKTVNKVYPASLRRFEKPKEALYTCLSQLDSSSWETVMAGLQTFVRLIRHHPEYVEAQIHLLTIALSKHVKNLRSQVSRAACSAANEFFLTHAKSLDADAEELSAALLNRTADTNKFLRGDALKALEAMCDALHPSKVILILTFRGAAHQNAVVRCTTAKLLNQLVFRIGCDKVFNMHKDIRDRLILTGANLLMEGSLETRNYTKNLFKQLSIHSQYQKLILDVIPSNIYRNIEKALKSIR
ncbi:unnamed protein product [Diamesa hyperborea]